MHATCSLATLQPPTCSFAPVQPETCSLAAFHPASALQDSLATCNLAAFQPATCILGPGGRRGGGGQSEPENQPPIRDHPTISCGQLCSKLPRADRTPHGLEHVDAEGPDGLPRPMIQTKQTNRQNICTRFLYTSTDPASDTWPMPTQRAMEHKPRQWSTSLDKRHSDRRTRCGGRDPEHQRFSNRKPVQPKHLSGLPFLTLDHRRKRPKFNEVWSVPAVFSFDPWDFPGGAPAPSSIPGGSQPLTPTPDLAAPGGPPAPRGIPCSFPGAWVFLWEMLTTRVPALPHVQAHELKPSPPLSASLAQCIRPRPKFS